MVLSKIFVLGLIVVQPFVEIRRKKCFQFEYPAQPTFSGWTSCVMHEWRVWRSHRGIEVEFECRLRAVSDCLPLPTERAESGHSRDLQRTFALRWSLKEFQPALVAPFSFPAARWRQLSRPQSITQAYVYSVSRCARPQRDRAASSSPAAASSIAFSSRAVWRSFMRILPFTMTVSTSAALANWATVVRGIIGG